MKIAVIGSGISGLSIANLLKNNHEVIVFEKDKNPGGLIRCERVNDCLFHKVGGHVFNSKNQTVLNWFWSYFNKEKEFVQAKRNAKVFFEGKIIGYPIENFIYLFEQSQVRKIVSELLELQKRPHLSPFDYDNFEDFLKGSFGDTLYELYFKPYNQKIWRTELNTVSMQWLEGKLPMPNIEEIFQNNIIRVEEEGMVHATFYYPKEGGSQFIIDRLRVGLTIKTGAAITVMEEKDGKPYLDGQVFDKVIYCGDIRKLPYLGKKTILDAGLDLNYLESLRSNGTSNLFCEIDESDISWMYIPGAFTRAHRIIYTGNFSESNNRGTKRKTCVVEFSGKVEYSDMIAEIKKLPGNLSPLSFNYEPNSYVIQDHRTRAEINAVKAVLQKKGIFLLGRFAEWEYYNMDAAVGAAFSLLENELFS